MKHDRQENDAQGTVGFWRRRLTLLRWFVHTRIQALALSLGAFLSSLLLESLLFLPPLFATWGMYAFLRSHDFLAFTQTRGWRWEERRLERFAAFLMLCMMLAITLAQAGLDPEGSRIIAWLGTVGAIAVSVALMIVGLASIAVFSMLRSHQRFARNVPRSHRKRFERLQEAWFTAPAMLAVGLADIVGTAALLFAFYLVASTLGRAILRRGRQPLRTRLAAELDRGMGIESGLWHNLLDVEDKPHRMFHLTLLTFLTFFFGLNLAMTNLEASMAWSLLVLTVIAASVVAVVRRSIWGMGAVMVLLIAGAWLQQEAPLLDPGYVMPGVLLILVLFTLWSTLARRLHPILVLASVFSVMVGMHVVTYLEPAIVPQPDLEAPAGAVGNGNLRLEPALDAFFAQTFSLTMALVLLLASPNALAAMQLHRRDVEGRLRWNLHSFLATLLVFLTLLVHVGWAGWRAVNHIYGEDADVAGYWAFALPTLVMMLLFGLAVMVSGFLVVRGNIQRSQTAQRP